MSDSHSHLISTGDLSNNTISDQATVNNQWNYTPGATNISPYQHTLAPTPAYTTAPTTEPFQAYQQSFDPWVTLPPISGLDELCEILGIMEEPALSTGDQGPTLTSVSGKRYALVNILRGQMEFMSRLNILLVHRQIVPESE